MRMILILLFMVVLVIVDDILCYKWYSQKLPLKTRIQMFVDAWESHIRQHRGHYIVATKRFKNGDTFTVITVSGGARRPPSLLPHDDQETYVRGHAELSKRMFYDDVVGEMQHD